MAGGNVRNELLPVPYIHVVFTLPHQLLPLALQNKKVVYDLLVPRQCRDPTGGRRLIPSTWVPRSAFLPCLHTWGQNLLANPHS